MPKGVYTRRRSPVEGRFWPKVDRNGPAPAHVLYLGPCWIWTAASDQNGYGKFYFNGRLRMAHVVAYILTTGHEPPPETPIVIHLCDGGAIGCVRPSHLKADTHAGNAADKVSKGRQAKGPAMGSPGTKNGRAKLSADDVAHIRQRYAAGGITQQALADEYGVSDVQVSDVIHMKKWTHI